MRRPSDTIPTDIGKAVSTKALYLLLFAVAGVAVFAIYPVLFSTGVDFYFGLAPATTHWLQGIPVFSDGVKYLEMPWLLPILAVLLWLTNRGAEAALALLAVTGIVKAWRLFMFTPPMPRSISGQAVSKIAVYDAPLALAACLFNLHLFDLFERGQIDSLILLGVLFTYVGIRRGNPYAVGFGWSLVFIRHYPK